MLSKPVDKDGRILEPSREYHESSARGPVRSHSQLPSTLIILETVVLCLLSAVVAVVSQREWRRLCDQRGML